MIRRFIPMVCMVLLGAWLALNAVSTLRHVIGFYTPLPIWDYWLVVEHLPEYQSFHLGVLWKQHNEHRIVFPEIV